VGVIFRTRRVVDPIVAELSIFFFKQIYDFLQFLDQKFELKFLDGWLWTRRGDFPKKTRVLSLECFALGVYMY